jgi:ParB family chromosome partitioning protein
VSKDNPRQSFDEEGLRRLGESILAHGQLQPIIVRSKGSQYELVVGERRLRASKLVGLTEIDATVQELDDATCVLFRLIENAQREDLTDAEKGNAIAIMLEKYPEKFPTIETVATELKKGIPTVRVWLYKSDRLSETVKKLVAGKQLSDRVTSHLLKFNHESQNKLAKAIIKFEVPRQKEEIECQREFVNRYSLAPEKYPTVESLEDLANEVKGVKKVKIDLEKLSPKARAEVERKLKEAKEEAKELRKSRKRRVNRRPQGRPRKTKIAIPKLAVEEKKPIPEPTFPIRDVKVVSVALNFPEPLWEKIHRYITKTNQPMLLEEAIISLLESHPLLREV